MPSLKYIRPLQFEKEASRGESSKRSRHGVMDGSISEQVLDIDHSGGNSVV